jgi:hypothetical protein
LRTRGLVVGALLVGLLGFLPLGNILFVGPASLAGWHGSEYGALGLTLAAYGTGGLAIGWLRPDGWLLGGLIAWVCVSLSLYNLVVAISDPVVREGTSVALVVLVAPLIFALGGAYLGRIVVRARRSVASTRGAASKRKDLGQ